MSMVLCEKSDIVAIADKIRAANGTTAKLTMQEIIDNYGSSGGTASSLVTGTFSISEDMYEPGINEYVLTSNELKADTRTLILIGCTATNGLDAIPVIFRRNTTSEEFTCYNGDYNVFGISHTSGEQRVENNSTVVLYGAMGTNRILETMYFIAV